MPFQNYSIVKSKESILGSHSVLRSTYFLLSLTLLFSAVTAALSVSVHARPGFLLTIVGMFGLSYLTQKLRYSPWGLVAIFAFTGFMGFTLGPILDMVMRTYANGGQIIMTSLGTTGLIFLALSAYVLTTRKNFSYLGGFLFIAMMVVFLGAIAGIFLQMPVFNIIISGAFALISSAYILYTTSAIIHGGEDSYIMATASLYVSIFNLFVSLIQILSAFAGNRD
ncbi:MAG: Bax inhibitor-1/YccA family protein [Gammaproteobacteria bacterium]|nr:Bax inhibitor-1/YccA family protein [Gammaproteobacteria bacterium]